MPSKTLGFQCIRESIDSKPDKAKGSHTADILLPVTGCTS